MGDRIAILTRQSHIEQYDAPATILTAPANAFVEGFIGSGAVLKRLDLTRVGEVALARWPVAPEHEDRAALQRRLAESDQRSLLLVDGQNRPLRWLRDVDLRAGSEPVEPQGGPSPAVVGPRATLADALGELVASSVGCVIVTDGNGRYEGVVDLETVMHAVDEMRARAARDAPPEPVREAI